MGFNRKTKKRATKSIVLNCILSLCLKLKRQVTILEVSEQLRNEGIQATPEDVRHRMQDVRKAHKKDGTKGDYTARSGFVATGKTSIIEWDKDGSTPLEYFVGKVPAKYIAEKVKSV